MTRKLSAQEKKERKPASRACVFCHRKHLQCSNERPCKNCVKRNIGHQCHDVIRKRAKYLHTNSLPEQLRLGGSDNGDASPQAPFFAGLVVVTPTPPVPVPDALVAELPINPVTAPPNSMLDTTKDVMLRLLSGEPPLEVDGDPMDVPSRRSTPLRPFLLNYLNQEYLMLGDILLQLKPTLPLEYPQDMPLEFASGIKELRPFISLGFSSQPDRLAVHSLESLLTNLNHNLGQVPELLPPVPYTLPLATHQLYQTVNDIYAHNTMNYDYPQLYHALTYFLKKRFLGPHLLPEQRHQKRHNLLVILKLIALYRPTFISAHKNLLKPYDLQFLEMTFQRSLIDYEKLGQLNLSPTVMWRRTGEIVSITDDLLSLLGFDIAEILGKRTFIMELMYDDELIINYFKLFKLIAVGNLHSSIMTKLKLIKNTAGDDEVPSNLTGDAMKGLEQNDYIEFCLVWTVKRDIFDIPMLIIGQFLPVLATSTHQRRY